MQFLAEALIDRDYQATVVSTRAEAGTDQAVINGVKVYYVGLKNLYWPFGSSRPEPLKPLWHTVDTYNPAMAQAVADILDAEQPDIVHTNNLTGFSVAVWQAVKARGLPLVHTLRDYYLLCPRTSMFRDEKNCETQCWDCRLYSALRRQHSSKVDAVVGNSNFILQKHLELGCFHSVSRQNVVYNAYEADEPVAEKTLGQRLRLGYLGRLAPTKGIELTLEALKNSLTNDVEFYIAGEGDHAYESRLKSTYPFPAVHYLGFVKPKTLFEDIDVLLVPSLWHEPLPRTIFEAYAHGVPVIGSNRGGIPEIIDEGKTGYVFNPDHPAELVGLLHRITQNPTVLPTLRRHCLEKAELFRPKRTRDAYTDLYTILLRGHQL